MKAQILKSYGENSSFELTSIDKPTLNKPTQKKGYALVKVKATSINPIDTKIKKFGIPVVAPPLPAILHGDISGIVEEVADDVHNFKKGDEVYACAGGCYNEGGAAAEYMLADAKFLAHKPKNLNFQEAAALPLVGITAYEALMNKNIKKNDDVLIHAGCGGVGHIAIQMAKILGANVSTTISSSAKAKIAQNLGADHCINYKEESVSQYINRLTNGVGFDLVMDTVGGNNLQLCFEAIKITGKIVTIIAYGTVVDLSVLHAKAATLYTTFMLLPLYTGKNRNVHGNILKKIAKWVENGNITPLIDREFKLKDINKAYKYFEKGEHIGKVIINVD